MATIASKYTVGILGTDDPSSHKDRLVWRILDDPKSAADDLPGTGSWVLLLFAQTPPDLQDLPDRLDGDCQGLQRVLKMVGADLAVLSAPDDFEWTVAEIPPK